MKDIIILFVLVMIIGLILLYLKKNKKKGCIGCPYANKCQGGCSGK